MASPEFVTAPVESMGVSWIVGAAALALLISFFANLLWTRVGGAAGPSEEEPPHPRATPETLHTSHSMHDVHGSPVDEGLSAVLGQGAPVFDPPPVAELDPDDPGHVEHISADEVARREDYGVHDDGSIHDAVPTTPLQDEGGDDDGGEYSEAATEVIG